MSACCVSGYRPLRGIRHDECHWPPRLAPAGPWEICNCAEGEIVRRQRSEIVVVEKTGSVGRTDEHNVGPFPGRRRPGADVLRPDLR